MTPKDLTRIIDSVTAALKTHIDDALTRELHYAVHAKVMAVVAGQVESEIRAHIRNRVEDSLRIQITVNQK